MKFTMCDMKNILDGIIIDYTLQVEKVEKFKKYQ